MATAKSSDSTERPTGLRKSRVAIAALLVGCLIVLLFLIVSENEIYVTNGTGATVQVNQLRVSSQPTDIPVPLQLKPGGTAFASFRSVFGMSRRLELVLGNGNEVMSCDLEVAMRACFFRVFLTSDGLNCDPCDKQPRAT